MADSIHSPEIPPAPEASPVPRNGLRLLGTGLLIAGSALFGGLAVALWDRKSLTRLRQPHPEPASLPEIEDEKID